jgi:type VI protein secretion system component Hcp
MARHIIGIALALLVGFSMIAHADATDKKPTPPKKGHVSMGMIVFTKHVDKATPYLN